MYKPSPKESWQGRIDPLDGDLGLRFHQKVVRINLAESIPSPTSGPAFALMGFVSDEGVRRNQGRPGAKDGPEALRKALGGMAWHFGKDMSIIDGGDVVISAEKLEEAQEEAGRWLGKLIDLGYFPIHLGGGHEIAWASFLGYANSTLKGQDIGIINFDAHFDLRQADQASSGTPFLQIAQWCQSHNQAFHYFCLGIQSYSNTQALFKTANKNGVSLVSAQELLEESSELLFKRMDDFMKKVDHIYLSIDLDGFDGAFAPGVSSPSTGGFGPREVFPFLRKIAQSGKLRIMDIAELNPSFDQDHRTAKLGARCIFELLSNFNH